LAAVPSIGRATRVEGAAAAGADATSELYERYSGQVFGYCLHQLGSREEAEDAVQTTFMNAFRGLARGVVPEAEQAWLFKIAHNVCLSRRRSSWRRGRVEAPNNMEVLQEIIPARERVADELIRLQDVLEQMPENQRRAILLREWQGLSYREVADELDVSQAAVETLIFRARRSLAAGLEEASSGGTWRKRLRRGADVGGLVAFVKTLFGGGGTAAMKVVAAIALAGAAVATTAAQQMRGTHHTRRPTVVVPAAVQRSPMIAATIGGASVSAAKSVGFGQLQNPAAHRPVVHPPAPSQSAPAGAEAASDTAAAGGAQATGSSKESRTNQAPASPPGRSEAKTAPKEKPVTPSPQPPKPPKGKAKTTSPPPPAQAAPAPESETNPGRGNGNGNAGQAGSAPSPDTQAAENSNAGGKGKPDADTGSNGNGPPEQASGQSGEHGNGNANGHDK
jgi:RNA polymerase sigma factor (sigma-70 family)